MPVEYFIHSSPQHPHEAQAVLKLAQAMQRAFAASDQFYLLLANTHFWKTQADALVLSPSAITLIELKSCKSPVFGRAQGPWHILPKGDRIHGGSQENPFQQVSATREKLIKYLDRNRRRFLSGSRVRELAHRWGHTSAAIVFAPHLHPGSDIVVPAASRAWLGVMGLNEVVEFLFSRCSPQLDLRPQELRNLATEALGCQPWTDIETLLPAAPTYGYLWLLDEAEKPAYAFPITGMTTIGRSRDNTLVVPRRFLRTSRRHARVTVADGVAYLCDNDSTHGLFVNGEQVTTVEHALQNGDRIALGDAEHRDTCHLRFERHPRRDMVTEPTVGTV